MSNDDWPARGHTWQKTRGSYRVRYKKGDLEVEIESTDKAYVEEMLEKIRKAKALKPSASS